MRPARPVHIAAQAITPFIGKGHPGFIAKGHPDFGKRENPTLERQMAAAVEELVEGSRVDPETVEIIQSLSTTVRKRPDTSKRTRRRMRRGKKLRPHSAKTGRGAMSLPSQ